MRGNAARYDKVMLLTDLTEKSQAALGYARAMAKYYDSHLVILHVLSSVEPPFPSLRPTDSDDHGAEAVRERLKMMGKALRAEGISVQLRLCRGQVASETILRQIRSMRPDIIIQGCGRVADLRRPFVGSIAEGVFRSTEKPVLTVPAGLKVPDSGYVRFERILFATDFGSKVTSIANYAFALAEEFGARAYLCHVRAPSAKNAKKDDASVLCDAELHRLIAPSVSDWCESQCVVEFGKAANTILKLADSKNCDLIVLGAHALGRFGTRGRPGTVFRVIAAANCPVLTILNEKREERERIFRWTLCVVSDLSTSSLWSSTSVLYVWVRSSISILSLTRPFHNCAMRVP
jgi:nucleotide-binding universal stress UspA family protein